MIKKFHTADFWKQGYFFWPLKDIRKPLPQESHTKIGTINWPYTILIVVSLSRKYLIGRVLLYLHFEKENHSGLTVPQISDQLLVFVFLVSFYSLHYNLAFI